MAFNPFVTFQKNKRFWMAAILMVCMVTFVFCTGMKGDMQDRLIAMFGGSRGATMFTLDGRTIGSRDLGDLKSQRELANNFMKTCVDYAFKNVSQILFDENKKGGGEKDDAARKERLPLLAAMQETLAHRKSRKYYFETGVKFEDLVEFKLWQAEADRLGIRLEDEHLNFLFRMECLDTQRQPTISEQQLIEAQFLAVRNSSQLANNAMVRRAVAEEFRVRMAQLAVLRFQPSALRRGGAEGGFTLKFDDPNDPDEVRGPVTPAQIWDYFKSHRSEIEVTIIPLDPKDWASKMPEPTDLQKRDFFAKYKDKPNDPSSEDMGLETQNKAIIEFLYADPKSPAYLGLAQTLATLRRVNPIALDVMQSPLTTAARYMAIGEHDLKIDLERRYEVMTRNPLNKDRYHRAAYYSEENFAAPLLEWFAARTGPEAVASLIGAAALSPVNPLEFNNAVDGYLAWGAMGRPASDPKMLKEQRARHEATVKIAQQSEERRRSRVFADVAAFFPLLSQFPLDVAGPFMALDNDHVAAVQIAPNFRISIHMPPRYTIETVEPDIRGILADRVAEGWAQTNMDVVREKLSKATDAEQFKRELKVLIPKYKLTYGPSGDGKNRYRSRYEVADADELKVLKESFLKDIDKINMFEARDLTPERVLKPDDFWKMFFDGSENFAAIATYRAVSWPPEIKPNAARLWTKPNLRMVNETNVNVDDRERFMQHLRSTDPTKAPTNLDLFKTAARPILFWRSADLPANRQTEYDGINKQLEKLKVEIAKMQQVAKQKTNDPAADELRKKQAEAKDLEDMQARIVEGWKFDKARSEKALPEAKRLALLFSGHTNNFSDVSAEANKLKLKATKLPPLSPMQPAMNPGGVDYYEPTLPKDAIAYPRDDTVKQLLGLYDLKKPIVTGNKELDDINRDLFEAGKKAKLDGGFVQILTNKPRSMYYVAAVTNAPKQDPDEFRRVMRNAVGMQRDFFADRAQENEARQYRRDVIEALKKRYKYHCDDEDKARADFDDVRRGGAD